MRWALATVELYNLLLPALEAGLWGRQVPRY